MVGPNTEISMFTFLPLQGSVSSLSLVHQGAETGHVFYFQSHHGDTGSRKRIPRKSPEPGTQNQLLEGAELQRFDIFKAFLLKHLRL